MIEQSLYIIGNGFDRAHGMLTKYQHFRQWLVENNRYDVIHELQSAYPAKIKDDYLLWSEFEKALGEYDLDTVINWSWENLYLTVDSVGNMLFNKGFIEPQLPDIISEAFTKWISSIQLPTRKVFNNIGGNSLFLTFNYTDTLELLYQVPDRYVLHIHGRASRGEKLIVGHNRMIDLAEYWDHSLDLRENNERMQRLTDMNDLCKPVYEIMNQNIRFFKGLGCTKDIHVIGHSCGEIDFPYFRKIKESVPDGVMWHFNPFTREDQIRISRLINELGITNSNCK